MKKIIFSLIILIFAIYGCSGSAEQVDAGKVNQSPVQPAETESGYLLHEFESWMNLMPGGNNPDFHISGNVAVTQKTGMQTDKCTISAIKVYQDNKLLLQMKPGVQKTVSTEGELLINFYTERGINMPGMFDIDKKISAELLFTDGEEEFTLEVENITVQKIY